MSSYAYVPALDGVRGTAVLVVMLAHTLGRYFPGGNIGVDLFFVLSGYLITNILLSEFRQTGTISVRNFYIRRALRLLPALFLLIVLVTLYVGTFQPQYFGALKNDTLSVILYFYNWHRWAALDDGADVFYGYGHLWSLSIEEQFYILWPWLLLVVLPMSRRVFLAILILGITLPAIARAVLWESGPSLDLYFRTDLRFDNLMWGAVGAWISSWLVLDGRQARILGWIGGSAFVAFMIAAQFDLLSNGVQYLGGYTLISAAGMLMILACAHSPGSLLWRLMMIPALRWTGKISYGLYLWHLPVFANAFGLPFGSLGNNAAAFAISYAIASMSFYGMERYFLRMKSRLAPAKAGAVSQKPAGQTV